MTESMTSTFRDRNDARSGFYDIDDPETRYFDSRMMTLTISDLFDDVESLSNVTYFDLLRRHIDDVEELISRRVLSENCLQTV